MVFKIFKRSKVPDELPELASDKIGGFFNEEGKIVHKYLEEEESKNKPVLAFPEIEKPIASQKKDIKEDVSQKKDLIKGSLDNEKGFASRCCFGYEGLLGKTKNKFNYKSPG